MSTFLKEPFYLFKSPMIYRGSTEVFRNLFNPIYRFIYCNFFENAFTNEKFINGAKKVGSIRF